MGTHSLLLQVCMNLDTITVVDLIFCDVHMHVHADRTHVVHCILVNLHVATTFMKAHTFLPFQRN